MNNSQNLVDVFKTCHNYLFVNQGLSKQRAFEEFSTIITVKIYDEKFEKNLFSSLFHKDKKGIEKSFVKKFHNYLKVMNKDNNFSLGILASLDINLSDDVLYYICNELKEFNFIQMNADVKGIAYQEVMGSNIRGDKGEFYTPLVIVKMAVDLLEPEITDRILDPACGTGGFLIHVWRHLLNNFVIDESSSFELNGIDFNKDVVKYAALSLSMENCHNFNLKSFNSLNFNVNDEKINSFGSFDKILTNPPFGSKNPIKDKKILKQFDLAHKWLIKGNKFKILDGLRNSQSPDILFIERCYQFLKPLGKLAIVLPVGVLGNPGYRYVRYWILQNFHVLASIDLPSETFQPHTGTQTNLLILQKKPLDKVKEKWSNNEYNIYLSNVNYIGHDKRGKPIYEENKFGDKKTDDDGNYILKNDCLDVVKRWRNKTSKDTIHISDIDKDELRLDAGFYIAEGKRQFGFPTSFTLNKSMKLIKKKKYQRLDELCDIFGAPRFKRHYVENYEDGFPFLSGTNLTQFYPNVKYLSKIKHNIHKDKLIVEKGTILVTCSGTIGRVGMIWEDMDGWTASQHMIRLKPNIEKINPGYLFAFLSSEIAQSQLNRYIHGSVIDELSPKQISKVIIPRLDLETENKIGNIVIESIKMRSAARKKIEEGVNQFSEFFQL